MVDRMSEELWMEVHNTVQEAVTKTIPKKKKWLSEEALQIAVYRRDVKGKEKKDRELTVTQIVNSLLPNSYLN